VLRFFISIGSIISKTFERASRYGASSRATAFARKVDSYPEIDIDPATVETNIVRFRQ
jgi:hypothetical protein